MDYALKEAGQALKRKEVPIGAVIVRENRIIGRGYNQTETLQDPTAHAEMIAITAASTYVGSRRLEDCTLYVTLEPCAMCAGAIVLARIPRLVFGAFDPKAGACGTLYNLVQDARLNHRVDLAGGISAEQCGVIAEGVLCQCADGIRPHTTSRIEDRGSKAVNVFHSTIVDCGSTIHN